MRQVIESYSYILVIVLILWLGIAFTAINLHTVQARRLYQNVRTEVQSSNGAMVDDSNIYTSSADKMTDDFRKQNGFGFKYVIERQNPLDQYEGEEDETFIYNSIYKITFIYVYNVPLFGQQVYPIEGFA